MNNSIFLPLAISFYTFQQIAYQIDVYRRKTYEKNLINYILFVIFFPQLIAGPIVKHQVIKNQIDNLVNIKYNLEKILFGFIIFIIGLFKKIVIADNIAITSDSFFEAAKYEDAAFTFFESWGGVFSYSFQIYFDFSAYSDMAIGLAIILGIKIPINFNSPYKSCSIIDFWRTWHVTLSDFLREYVYFNLGGNRKGALLKYSNILITMLIGGFWHGASFMFILWGGLHGLLISLNHLWRFIFTKLNLMHVLQNNFIYLSCMRIFTFISVSLLWVFFRSENLLSIKNIFQGIIGMNGISLPYKMKQYVEFFLPSSLLNFFEFNNLGILGSNFIIFKLLALFFIVFLTPSVANIFFKNDLFIIDSKLPNLLKKRDIFVINYFWAIFIAVLFIISVTSINEIKEFVYFQF